MSQTAKHVAREAEDNPLLRVLARAGYAANGCVHILIGVISLVVALGGDGEADQTGALKAVASAPFGFVALWLLAVALGALAIWHVLEGLLARGERRWAVRVSEWGQALVFAALGAISASVALGARPDGDRAAEDASRGVLSLPGGPLVLGLVGCGIGIGGVAFVVMGVRRSFRKKISIPEAPGPVVTALGVIGFVAKGIALVIVAVLLTVAAIRVDPDAAGGLDGALSALLALTLGPWLVAAMGVGLIAYGVFCFFRARYARL